MAQFADLRNRERVGTASDSERIIQALRHKRLIRLRPARLMTRTFLIRSLSLAVLTLAARSGRQSSRYQHTLFNGQISTAIDSA